MLARWRLCKNFQKPYTSGIMQGFRLWCHKLSSRDGELGAALRYLSQRISTPYDTVKGVLTDIGTEELGHLEMICAIVYQLTKDLTVDEIKKQGFEDYYVDHTTGIYPISASGIPFSAGGFQSKGDTITDLTENLAADGTIA